MATEDIYGGCYCGGVRFSIEADTQPVWAGYCHCRDCRQAHASPLYQAAYIEHSKFQITAGAVLLKWYTRSESARATFKRYFCEQCGSKVYNTLLAADEDLRGTFPALFDNQEIATNKPWNALQHIYCAESFMDTSLLQDGLPKHPHYPT